MAKYIETYEVDGERYEETFEAIGDLEAKLKLTFFKGKEPMTYEKENAIFADMSSFFELLRRYGDTFKDDKILKLGRAKDILDYLYDTYVKDDGISDLEIISLKKVLW